MELIEKIGTRWHSNHFRRFGKFVCPFCGDVVERMIAQGRKAKSCGCATHLKARVIHGESRSRLYCTWVDMKSRCLNGANPRFHRYGGRGIKLCDAWRNYPSFKKWATVSGYADTLTIDRIDNDGDYCPDNCRWVTIQENLRNGRRKGGPVAGSPGMPKKLCVDVVKRIKSEYTGKYGEKIALAKKYGVSTRMIYLILNGSSWGYV